MWILLLAALVPGAAGAATDRAGAAATVPPALSRVDSLLAAGDAESALADLAGLQVRWGDDPLFGWQIADRRGVALLLAGQPEAALPLLESAVERRPLTAGNHRNLGLALAALGRRGRALSEFAQAVDLAPLDAGHRLDHAHYLAEFGLWGRAAAEFQVAAHLCGGCAEAERGQAVALLRADRPAEAVPPLLRLRTAGAAGADLDLLVAALEGAGQDSLLLAVLDEAPPAALDRRLLRAQVQAEGRLGSLPPARSLAHAASLQAGRPPQAVADDALFWGRVALNLLEADEALPGLVAADRAVALEPENVIYRNNRVVLLTRLGRLDDARREWEQVLRLDPGMKEQPAP